MGQYSTAPAYGSLGVLVYKKASFIFVIVPTIIIGVIYANVTAKFIFGRVLGKSRHAHSNTVVGWGFWIALMVAIWFIGFIFAVRKHFHNIYSTVEVVQYTNIL